MTHLSLDRLESAYQISLGLLLNERNNKGYWTGELSTSALSTATAVSSLALVQKHLEAPEINQKLIRDGLAWLAQHQNADGGWGDTTVSVSNLSTTMLGQAAFYLAESTKGYSACLEKAEVYLRTRGGSTVEEKAEAVRARYGKDRTFAVPILTTSALAGLMAWKEVSPLPFELACLPPSWFRFLRLPVVSYALPALIAIGQAVYHHQPPRNPVLALVRRLATRQSLRVLEAIQPSSGGFLEAVPLTSFVTLSLASIGRADHPVAQQGIRFLIHSVRPDGSWAIDSNLATWVTTLAVNALSAAGELFQQPLQQELRGWLLHQQYTQRHTYTGADAGGWAWTDLPGGVPDADDTPGALLALAHLSDKPDSEILEAAKAGIAWLLALQNRDGGWPTFCRGWGHLPFDRSGVDLTAHVLRAFAAWMRLATHALPSGMVGQMDRATRRGLAFLARQQRPDGSWVPLWFGNQYVSNDENPTYGTARVLAAYRDLDKMNAEPARRGIAWLLDSQDNAGGWGGAANRPSSVEETALAVEVLIDKGLGTDPAVNKGLMWLVRQVESGGLLCPSPIGFYFARLWYFEKLYPLVFTVAALGRALRRILPCSVPVFPETNS